MRSNRHLANIESARRLNGLLVDALSDLSKHDESILPLQVLRSQGALSRVELPSHGIRACALNTLKAAAEAAFEGGFQELDRNRRELLGALEKRRQLVAEGARRTKRAMALRIRDLELQNDLLLQDLFLLQRAFDIRCRQAFQYAKASEDPAVVQLSKRQHSDVLKGLTLMQRKQFSNVVSISGKASSEK